MADALLAVQLLKRNTSGRSTSIQPSVTSVNTVRAAIPSAGAQWMWPPAGRVSPDSQLI